MENYNNKDISESDIKLLAHKLLPEIKKYFSDEKIQKEFKQWLQKKQKSNPKTWLF